LPVSRHIARLFTILALASIFAAGVGVAPPAVGPVAAGGVKKVAVLVGPTEITDSHYLTWAEELADTAEAAGATVELAYCPTPAEAKAAVNGASIIVYFGHGSGFPNPYSTTEHPQWVNGWGLRDPAKPWDGETCEDDVLRYYGEDYLTGKLSGQGWTAGAITPAPGFVMVYSNACYTPGAGEARPAPPVATALARVSNYSSPILTLGGTYFATDLGSDRIVDLILRNPQLSFGAIFELGNGFDPAALDRHPHPDAPGLEAWLHRVHSPWLGDDYWFAFAGDPSRTPSGGTSPYLGPSPVAPFSDIVGSTFYGDILWLHQAGITGGCGGGRFCPNQAVTRAQMASFLVRALDLPPATQDYFGDDASSMHQADINALHAAGITGGCSDGAYCPNQAVTRAQMASFLARALAVPPSSQDAFADDDGSMHEADINAVAAAGIAGGCGASSYCPNNPVTRGQMAAFLHRALD
jgi:hypothetical protein